MKADWIELGFDEAGPGSDHQARLVEHCPFSSVVTSTCKLNAEIACRYGLTEVVVPELCPLRGDGLTATIHKREETSDE